MYFYDKCFLSDMKAEYPSWNLKLIIMDTWMETGRLDCKWDHWVGDLEII